MKIINVCARISAFAFLSKKEMIFLLDFLEMEKIMKTLKAFYVGFIVLVGAIVSFTRFMKWVLSVCKEI